MKVYVLSCLVGVVLSENPRLRHDIGQNHHQNDRIRPTFPTKEENEYRFRQHQHTAPRGEYNQQHQQRGQQKANRVHNAEPRESDLLGLTAEKTVSSDSDFLVLIDEKHVETETQAAVKNDSTAADAPICNGFITLLSYEANAPAQSLDCIPGEEMMCCDAFGYSMVTNGGAFTLFERGHPAEERKANAACAANIDALSLSLCSSKQKDYIVDGVLNICKSACDKVYKACSGSELVPSDIQDSKTLCERMWGGIENDSPCGSEWEADSFACTITSVNVSNGEKCYDYSNGLVSQEIIATIEESAYSDNQCTEFVGDFVKGVAKWTLVFIILGVVAFCCTVGCVIAACCGVINCCC